MPKYTYYDKANQQTVTVQATSKSWKFLYVVAWIIGIIALFVADTPDDFYCGAGIGVFIYYYAKIGRWWTNS